MRHTIDAVRRGTYQAASWTLNLGTKLVGDFLLREADYALNALATLKGFTTDVEFALTVSSTKQQKFDVVVERLSVDEDDEYTRFSLPDEIIALMPEQFEGQTYIRVCNHSLKMLFPTRIPQRLYIKMERTN